MTTGGANRLVVAARACSVAITAATFAASLTTGSSAMLTTAVHSLIDACSQGLLLYGLAQPGPSGATAERNTRELYFWSYVAALLLFAMGAGVSIYDGIDKLTHPAALQEPEISTLVLGAALMLEIGLSAFALAEFHTQRAGRPLFAALRAGPNPAYFTVLLEAWAAIAGIGIALAGIAGTHLREMPQADGTASTAIGLLLGLVAGMFAIEIRAVLTGDLAGRERQTSDPGGAATIPAAHAPADAMAPTAAAPAGAATVAPPAQQAAKPQLAVKPPQSNRGQRKRRR